jgi:nicotinamidase-related amidase
LSPSAWISGFEPKRSDMVFERPQPSCYANQLFADVVSQIGSFAIAGLVAEETCLATAIDASHRGHHVTFLSDASASRGRPEADARAVHVVTTRAIELFADTVTTRDWLVATSPRTPKGHRHG